MSDVYSKFQLVSMNSLWDMSANTFRTDGQTDRHQREFRGFSLKSQECRNGCCWNLEHITSTYKRFTFETCNQVRPVEAEKQIWSPHVKVACRETAPFKGRGVKRPSLDIHSWYSHVRILTILNLQICCNYWHCLYKKKIYNWYLQL